jgi:histidinol-phosphate aminotransferase
MAAAVTDRTKVVVLCTPNNPTGPALGDREVTEFLDRVPGHVLVVVDEAYREFVRLDDPLDALALVAERDNVVVMRTFAKAYGLAGLRVGYLVGPEPVTTAVRACSLPFGVSSIAQAAAVASLDAEAELLARVDAIVAERDRVTEALAGQGWDLPDAQGNFVWLPLGDRTAGFVAAVEGVGIMVRPFAGEGVRVTIGEPEANDRFVDVAGAWA